MDRTEVTIEVFEERLVSLIPALREAVDISYELQKNGESDVVSRAWEEFISEFLTYLKRKEKCEGHSLLGQLPIAKMFALF